VLEANDNSFRRSVAEKTLDFDRKQFHGVLAAVSLRVNNTPGLLALAAAGL